MTESMFPHRFAGRSEEAKTLEAFETPGWCAHSIHRYELMSYPVLDPCCGHGILSEAARKRGYKVLATDIADWGYGDGRCDFLETSLQRIIVDHGVKRDMHIGDIADLTVLINPPFSKATAFVEHAWRQGVRKIVCFQRWPWWESIGRTEFWDKHAPNRIYACRERATCWRFDIPPEERVGGTPTSHAFYVWERNQPRGTLVSHLDRSTP